MTLTCRECNNTAGSAVDSHAASEDRFRRALAGSGDDVRLRFGNGVPGLLQVTDEAFYLKVDKAHSNPTSFDKFHADLRHQATLGPLAVDSDLLKVTIPVPFEERRARISYLRSAYLAVFAHWGYRMAFGPAFQIVRRQLRDWSIDTLPNVPVARSPKSTLALLTGRHESVGPFIMVEFKGWQVILPGHPDDATWWHRFGAAVESDDESPLAIEKQIKWPNEPRHVLDHSWPVGPTESQQLIDFFGDGAGAGAGAGAEVDLRAVEASPATSHTIDFKSIV